MPHTPGILPLSSSAPELRAELERLERELAAGGTLRDRRVLSIERRRTIIALDILTAEVGSHS